MLSLCIYYNYLLIDNCVGLFKNYYITICSMPTYMYRIIQVFKKIIFLIACIICIVFC